MSFFSKFAKSATGKVENLQGFCRVKHHIFFKLRTESRSPDEKEDLKNLLDQLNLPPSTKENGVDFKKQMKKIGEVRNLTFL